jgi:prepilin-type N-terminal cleavage/methylation domain-containing protein
VIFLSNNNPSAARTPHTDSAADVDNIDNIDTLDIIETSRAASPAANMPPAAKVTAASCRRPLDRAASPRRTIPNPKSRIQNPKSRRAFTLMEILIATALTALVLLALNTLVFSMGELWGRNSEARLFDLHVRSVTRYLEAELRTAALPPVGVIGQNAFSSQEMETEYSVAETVLTFDLPAGSRLLNWPERALPEVACAIAVRPDQGLVLLWHSRVETNFAEERPRETVITPLVTAIAFEYYNTDMKTWELEETPRQETSGEFSPPGRLRLTFKLGGLSREIALTLPVATAGFSY